MKLLEDVDNQMQRDDETIASHLCSVAAVRPILMLEDNFEVSDYLRIDVYGQFILPLIRDANKVFYTYWNLHNIVYFCGTQ